MTKKFLRSVAIGIIVLSSFCACAWSETTCNSKEDCYKQYAEKGMAYFKKKDYPNAIAYFLKALNEKPNSSVSMTYLGICYCKTDRINDSIAVLNTAIKTAPNSPEAKIAKKWLDVCIPAATAPPSSYSQPAIQGQASCTPRAQKGCNNGEVYWFDSCGKPGEAIGHCSANSECTSGQCFCISGYDLVNGQCTKMPTPRTETCRQNASKACFGGHIYNFDSCGIRGSIYETCPENAECESVACRCKEGYELTSAMGPKMKDRQCQEIQRVESSPLVEHDNMVFIPAGEFWMGCSPGDNECASEEAPGVKVYIDGFWIDKYEVTQGDYKRVMGSNPSSFSNCGDSCPVERVTWDEATEYCGKVGKRLPTEAEWEKAARGGSGSRYYWGGNMNGEYAWYSDNSGSRTHSVGQKKPNAYGLYDTTGNVWEWVEDCLDEGWYGKLSNGQWNPLNKCSDSGGNRVIRGGGWSSVAWLLRVSLRDRYSPDDRLSGVGFRCVQGGNESQAEPTPTPAVNTDPETDDAYQSSQVNDEADTNRRTPFGGDAGEESSSEKPSLHFWSSQSNNENDEEYDAEYYVNSGNAHLKTGYYQTTPDWDSAIVDYTQAINLKPDYAEAYFLRGIAYGHNADYLSAVKDYTQAIKLKPDYAEAYNARGYANYAIGDRNQGKKDLEKAKKLGYVE